MASRYRNNPMADDVAVSTLTARAQQVVGELNDLVLLLRDMLLEDEATDA